MDTDCEYCDGKFERLWGKHRKPIEIGFLSFLALLLVSSFIMLLLLNTKYVKTQNSKQNICFSKNCLETADELLSKVDLTINPCEDFGQFTCGTFLNITLQPNEFNSTKEQMILILEEPVYEKDMRYVSLTKSFYQACILSRGEPNRLYLEHVIKELGGWPIIEGNRWKGHYFTWISTSYKLMKRGLPFHIFFDFTVEELLHIKPPQVQPFYQHLSHGFNTSLTGDYLDYLIEISVAFGADRERANRDMKNVLELEIELSKILTEGESTKDRITLSFRTLENRFSYVPWMQFMNTMLEPIKRISLEDKVVIERPQYFEKLAKLLIKTPKRVLANYIVLRVVRSNVDFLDEKIQSIEKKFLQKNSGTSSEPYRKSEKCLAKTVENLEFAARMIYMEEIVNKSNLDDILEIYDEIRKEFEDTLSGIESIDEKLSKRDLMEKAQVLKKSLTAPFNHRMINNYYKDLEINVEASVLQNLFNFNRFRNQKLYGVLGKRRATTELQIMKEIFSTKPKFLEDRIPTYPNLFPQGHFFDKDRPNFTKYASIGIWFRENLLEANQIRNMQKITVWITQIVLKSTYLAYTKNISNGFQLPGINYAQRQLFWISLGNIWCSFKQSGQKSDDFHRFYTSIMEMTEFSNDFQCF